MSVTTEADKQLNAARENVNAAIKSLSGIVIDECWGSDEFNSEFKETMHTSLNELVAIRERLRS